MNNFVIIGILVLILLIIAIILIVLSKKKNKDKDKEILPSILDIKDIGVSANDQEFSYGYEKEETIVMQPINNNLIGENEENQKPENVENSKSLNISTNDARKDTVIFDEDNKKDEHIDTIEIDN